MAGDEVRIVAAGGMEDGAIGTDASRIMAAIQAADAGAGVVVMTDLGSAVLSASTALELLDPAQAARVRLSRGPVVEGAIIAAIQASIGDDLQAVCDAADAGSHAGQTRGLIGPPTCLAGPGPRGGLSSGRRGRLVLGCTDRAFGNRVVLVGRPGTGARDPRRSSSVPRRAKFASQPGAGGRDRRRGPPGVHRPGREDARPRRGHRGVRSVARRRGGHPPERDRRRGARRGRPPRRAPAGGIAHRPDRPRGGWDAGMEEAPRNRLRLGPRRHD